MPQNTSSLTKPASSKVAAQVSEMADQQHSGAIPQELQNKGMWKGFTDCEGLGRQSTSPRHLGDMLVGADHQPLHIFSVFFPKPKTTLFLTL